MGSGAGVCVAVGRGVAVGCSVAVGDSVAVAVGVGSGTGVAVGCGAAVAVGTGATVAVNAGVVVGSSPLSQATSAISAKMVSVAQMRAEPVSKLVFTYFSYCQLVVARPLLLIHRPVWTYQVRQRPVRPSGGRRTIPAKLYPAIISCMYRPFLFSYGVVYTPH